MPKQNKVNKAYRGISLSIFTAVLAAILSVIGYYFTSKIQAANDKSQKQFEFKMTAYQSFLNSNNNTQSPVIAEILGIGELTKHVATDSEIQSLEKSFEKLIKLNDEYNISWQLDNNFNILRLHGSDKVIQICDDILAVLALREHSVDWTKYPVKLQELRQTWITKKDLMQYGYESRVSNDQRIMFILVRELYKTLLDQLRIELQER